MKFLFLRVRFYDCNIIINLADLYLSWAGICRYIINWFIEPNLAPVFIVLFELNQNE